MDISFPEKRSETKSDSEKTRFFSVRWNMIENRKNVKHKIFPSSSCPEGGGGVAHVGGGGEINPLKESRPKIGVKLGKSFRVTL